MSEFGLSDKILFLRLNRISHVPSAYNAAMLFQAEGFEVLVCEFSMETTNTVQVMADDLKRVRMGSALAQRLPHAVKAPTLFVSVLARLTRKIRKEGKPKFIIANGIQEQVLAYLLFLLFRIPYGVYTHEIFNSSEVGGWNRWFLMFEKAALLHAKLVIFPDQRRAKKIRLRYGLDIPSFVVANCPRLRTPQERVSIPKILPLPPETKLLLYLGGIGENNGLELAVQALTYVEGVHLVLCGWANSSFLEKLKQTITRLHLHSRVSFIGPVNKTKWDWLDQADFSLCLYEPVELRLQCMGTASNKVMESLSSGVPVLVPNTPEFQALIAEQDLGQCSALTPPAIAEHIRKWLSDPELAQRQARNGRNKHLETWNFETQFQPVLHYFNSLHRPTGQY